MSPRPNPRDYVKNFRTFEAPATVKIRLMMKNHAIKVRKASSCCGNYGEPGC